MKPVAASLLPGTGRPACVPVLESAGRVLVAVPRTEESRFRAMCEARDLPVTRVGVVDQGPEGGEPSIEVQGQFSISLAELRSTSEGVLPGLFG